METILVVGATGNTGSQLIKELQGKANVIALSRDVARAKQLLGPAVEVLGGDVQQLQSLQPILSRTDRMYVALHGTPSMVATENALIDAARAAGVKQYVKISGVRARSDSPSRIQQMHGAIHQHLVQSGLGFTVLQPNFFMQNFLGMAAAVKQGALPFPTGDGKAALIDARDIASAAAVVLTTEGHLGRTYELTGPESLSHGDAARIFSEVLKRTVQFVDVPPAAFEQGGIQGGMDPWFAGLLTDVYVTLYGQSLLADVSGDLPKLLGRAPNSLASFVGEHAAAFTA